MTAWRIVSAAFVAIAFDGEGAREFGGRWNSKGISIVYCAGSQALAVLEMLVHLDRDGLLDQYRLISVEFDESLVETVGISSLPSDWRQASMTVSVRALGDEWATSLRSAVLRVPSAILPSESNYLLNPRHPDFGSLRIGDPQPYRFDPRLK